MKYLKTFESFGESAELNEGLFKGLLDSPVYNLFMEEGDEKGTTKKEKIMKINVPGYIQQALRYNKYTDKDTKKSIDLSDLTEEDYKKAIEMGDSNKWANPDGKLLGGPPKFFKEADEKMKKAYKYLYSRIDDLAGKEPHSFGQGPK